MIITKMIITLFTIIFCILGLTKALPYNLSLPLALISLSVVNIINAILLKRQGKKSYKILLVISILILIFIIINSILILF